MLYILLYVYNGVTTKYWAIDLFYNLGENIGGLCSQNRSFPVTLPPTGRNCRVNDLRAIVSSGVTMEKEGTQCWSVRCNKIMAIWNLMILFVILMEGVQRVL